MTKVDAAAIAGMLVGWSLRGLVPERLVAPVGVVLLIAGAVVLVRT